MTDNYLLDAVDKLTLNHITKVAQSNEAGISCISEVDHEPLLLQLREAIAGGIGSKGASGSDGSTRIPFDPGAQALFDSIARQINAWYQTLPGAVEERYIHDRLRDWYIDYSNRLRAGKVSEATERDTLRVVEGWVRRIEAMFDPPTTLELTTGCPVCEQRWAYDPKTGDKIAAIIIEYRNIGVETFDKATGLCRSCEAVWRGGSALRALRYDIDAREAAG